MSKFMQISYDLYKRCLGFFNDISYDLVEIHDAGYIYADFHDFWSQYDYYIWLKNNHEGSHE
ncbi:hypothetical protein C2G38_2231736 [Gigaspora rosea]|uniref:Uncharacterized protein n=1 Tax=Gigaspora rosea TaxID=44941 RepID=A0A397TSN9_9GLOM|nr:hypothetical protein C2G38_2231736 [Gigaspora rosea]